MNDFGLVQLIWIKRLVSETARINTLIECNRLSERDVNRYKSVISAIDDFCAFVINSQNWRDFKNISSIVDEVEMVLFQHFYEQIGGGDEVNLRFENPFIENQRFGVIDDNDFEKVINGPVLEGDIVEIPNEFEFEINDENPLLELFDMKPDESREISVVDFIKILTQNQEGLSFTLAPEAFPDEEDILSEDEEVSLEEFIAHLIDFSSSKGMDFGIFDYNDDFD